MPKRKPVFLVEEFPPKKQRRRKPHQMPRKPKGTPRRKARIGTRCMFDGCEEKSTARHMCPMHYMRWWRGVLDEADGPAKGERHYGTISRNKGLRVIAAFVKEPDISISELARRFKLARSTVRKLVRGDHWVARELADAAAITQEEEE